MPAPRRFFRRSPVRWALLLLSSFPFATSSDSNDDGTVRPERPVERYYFGREVDFLARQSMILGDHPGAEARGTATDDGDERIARLRFLEKALRTELEYVRRLRAMKRGGDGATSLKGDEKGGDAPNKIPETRSGATSWPARLPPKEEEGGVDHDCDYEWAEENGFGRMHKALKCTEHADNQNKPIYTPAMWGRMWEAFRDSTLFPFPLPGFDECPDLPYHVDYTPDEKGRGNFARVNIKAGQLVHAGRPNTVFFLDAESWYRFATSLPTMMACDAMEWAWQQDLTNTGNVVLCLNMDEAAFFNHGGEGSNNMELGPNMLDYYAYRDIERGEELLYDYDRFDYDVFDMDL